MNRGNPGFEAFDLIPCGQIPLTLAGSALSDCYEIWLFFEKDAINA